MGEQLVRGEVDVREGPYGGPQAGHRGRRVNAVAHHVTHDQRDPGAGQRNHVEPVPADVRTGATAR